MMKKGQVYEGVIDRVEFPNHGKITLPSEERVITVKNGIPGQKVRFSINKVRKGKAEVNSPPLLIWRFPRHVRISGSAGDVPTRISPTRSS